MSVRRQLTPSCLAAAISSLLASGCAPVGPDFTRPEVPWLEGWQGGSLQNVVTPSPHGGAMTPDEWWLLFDDSVLGEVVAEALRLNPGVRTAGARILEARAQLGIAGAGRYPQLQQLSGNVLEVGEDSSGESSSSYTTARVSFDVAWELDFWGRYRRAIEAADAAYFASIAQYDDVQVLVAAQAASLYATIRTVELRLRITHENAAIQRRSLEITERLFKSGNESELDVQQAKSLYLSTIATIPELEAALRQTQNALSVLLARPPGVLPEMSARSEEIPEASLDVVVDMPAELLRRRPDVRAAEMQLAAQSALIGVSEASLYPSFALVGSVGLSDTSLASSPGRVDWTVGPTFVWNIFDYGRLKNDVLVQDARFQQLYENYQDTVLRAAREVDDAAVSFATNRAQVDILDEAVQAARRSLDIATIQYRE
jgi:NodT family efflux transporter outer membrane factor (OMF) lipoprotein